MIRVCVSSMLMAFVSLAPACQTTTRPAPGLPPVATTSASTTPLTTHADVAEPPLGSEPDLRARRAFRASDSKQVAPELAGRWLTLTIQTQGADGSWWALGAGGQLRSGEVLVAEVELHRPAHVYVINVDATGRAVLLYPDAAHEPDVILGRGTHRLPSESSEYPNIKLDGEVGTEHLFVVAAPRPIADVDRDVGAIVARLQRGESPPLTGNDPDPPAAGPTAEQQRRAREQRTRRAAGRAQTRADVDRALTEANEGLTPTLRSRGAYRSRAEGAAVDARPGADGVLVIPFPFEHI